MIGIKNYVKATSLEEAYTLAQKPSCVLGGMLWLKMNEKVYPTAIDLSGLGLDEITEDENEFSIGCMTTLRQLELHEGLNAYANGAFTEAVRSIVGVQFRNLATVGGSIFGKYGFSDVWTVFLALDTEVEFYHAGRMTLAEFGEKKIEKDILVRLIVKKVPVSCAYLSMRNTKTDFPVLAVAVSRGPWGLRASVGARPQRAVAVDISGCSAKEAAEKFTYSDNMRGSAAYRKHLAEVLIRRGVEKLGE